MLYGYARISTAYEEAKDRNQTFERQVKILTDYGINEDDIYKDRITGGSKTSERPGYDELMSIVQPGDTIVVTELSRFSRSLSDLMISVNELLQRQIGIVMLKEKLEFSTTETNPMAKFQLHLFGAIAEFEKSIIQSRVNEGLAAARARGVKLGRPRTYDPVMEEQVVFDYKSGMTYDDIMKKYHITRPTISKWCKKYHDERKQKLKVVLF